MNLREINVMLRTSAPNPSTKRHLAFNESAEQTDVIDAKRPALPRRIELMHASGGNGAN